MVQDIDELTDPEGSVLGFNLYCGRTVNYFTSQIKSSTGVIVETTNAAQAAAWFFEEAGDYLKLYTYVDGVKKYLHNTSGKYKR